MLSKRVPRAACCEAQGSFSPGQGCHDDSRDKGVVTMPALLVPLECDRLIHTRASLARFLLMATDVALVSTFTSLFFECSIA
jgi:hypothetical protein